MSCPATKQPTKNLNQTGASATEHINIAHIASNQQRELFINCTSLNGFKAFLKKYKQTIGKPSAWKCSCGCIIPKKGAKLSGGPQYKQGYHVHCPQCGRTLAQFINPSETQ